nr:hypothetical protein [uncultured Campylobacter sp.]
MNAVFFIIHPLVGILLNLARPFTACISSILPSTGRIAEEAQTQRAMQFYKIFLFWLILAKISEILKERYADFLLAAR